MNRERRKAIEEIRETIDDLLAQVDDLRDQEQGAFDNMPEGLQNTERGEAMQTAIDYLEQLFSSLEEASSYADDIING